MPALKNPKHEMFCREVAGGASHAHAWVLAGNNTNANNVARLVAQPRIQLRIAELRGEFNRASGIQLRYLQEKLFPLATSDVTDYFEADAGKLKLRDVTKLPPEIRSALSELRIDPDGTVTVKTHDKKSALDSLIKTVGGFAPDRLDVAVTDTRPTGNSAGTALDYSRRMGWTVRVMLRELKSHDDYQERDLRLAITGIRQACDTFAGAVAFDPSFAAETVAASPMEFVRYALLALSNATRRVISDGDPVAAKLFGDWLERIGKGVKEETPTREEEVSETSALGTAS